MIAIACAPLLVHVLTGGRYGFHRDELATLDDARHLAWGYVAYPPVTPFFGRISLLLFGTSLAGFRFFAALADAVAVLLTGLIVRELGGSRRAELLAAGAVVPFSLAAGALMQYVSFDYLAWVLTSFFLAKLCRTGDPRWWVAVGLSIGFGMLTKYSMLFCVAGIGVGVLVAPQLRAQFRSKWLWLGVALSILVFLPNLLWQWRHDFISLEFLRQIHERDIRIGRTTSFLPDQVKLNVFVLPIAFCGLWFFFVSNAGRAFRILGFVYLVPLIAFIALKGRGYYLAPAYPVLFAGGSVWIDELLARSPAAARRTIWPLAVAAVVTTSLILGAATLPLAPINSAWFRRVVKINEDFVEEIGWPELVQTIAAVRDKLPETDRAHFGILAGNYGEAGAVNLYGPRFGLPQAISGTNSFWLRGYGDPAPDALIVVGFSQKFVERYFAQYELAAHITNSAGVSNEETRDHPDIFVCRRLKQPWSIFWPTFRRFG